MDESNEVDVVVAGAGPVGLMLAAELHAAGVSVLVLERLSEMDETIKAASIGPVAAEALRRRGFGARLEAAEAPLIAMLVRQVSRVTGMSEDEARAALADPERRAALLPGLGKAHFSGLFVIELARQHDPDRRPVFMAQQELERMLAEHLADSGVPVLREHEIVGLEQAADGVEVQVLTPSGPARFRSRYLVGCDGGRSTVRRLSGFEFPGTAGTITGRQALVELADPQQLGNGWQRTPVGMLVHGPVPGRVLTVEFDGPPADRNAPITLAEIQQSLHKVSGTDVTVTAVKTATRFTDNTRQATSYRDGRVFLAGDAAHVHSPFGGQGLNLGLTDAVNLGWKLAAQLRGWAPEGLLDTYTTERHPVGARVLWNTMAQVALLRPDAQTTALRELFTELTDLDPVNQLLGSMMFGLEVRYDLGDGHPLTGRSCPDLELRVAGADTRLSELATDGRGLLLDLADRAEMRAAGDGWADRVRVVTADCAELSDVDALLVRPDGYIAWAAKENGSTAELGAALEAWFGKSLGRSVVEQIPVVAELSG